VGRSTEERVCIEKQKPPDTPAVSFEI